jgi:hypothetical protein
MDVGAAGLLIEANRVFVIVTDGCGYLSCEQQGMRPAVLLCPPKGGRVAFAVTTSQAWKAKNNFHKDIAPNGVDEGYLTEPSWVVALAHSCDESELEKQPKTQRVLEEKDLLAHVRFTVGKRDLLSKAKPKHRHLDLCQGSVIRINGLLGDWLVLSPPQLSGHITLLFCHRRDRASSLLYCMATNIQQGVLNGKWMIGGRDWQLVDRRVSMEEWNVITGSLM